MTFLQCEIQIAVNVDKLNVQIGVFNFSKKFQRPG